MELFPSGGEKNRMKPDFISLFRANDHWSWSELPETQETRCGM